MWRVVRRFLAVPAALFVCALIARVAFPIRYWPLCDLTLLAILAIHFARIPHRRAAQNMLIGLYSILLGLAAAEGLALVVGPAPPTPLSLATAHLDDISRAAGVSRNWFFSDPPPLANRHAPPQEWMKLTRDFVEPPQFVQPGFRSADLFKAWNVVYIGDPCKNPLLRNAPGRLYVYRPIDGAPFPRFRFLPDATTPLGLVTNQLGWRGPPAQLERPRNLVRIVFVGASTTVNSHFYPYSYPEFVGHWLDLWGEARNPGIRFEVLNAGREGMNSTDIEAIVRNEVMPLHPDLVVYYEGANQFDLKSLLPNGAPVQASSMADPTEREGAVLRTLSAVVNEFAFARLIEAAVEHFGSSRAEGEWPKPHYGLARSSLLDEPHPDIRQRNLPLNLPTILGDLDRMRADAAAGGSEVALSSFVWLVHDGMVLDPARDKMLLDFLNITQFPLRYHDIARAAAFQNRVFAEYAAKHGLAFFDVARQYPKDSGLFTDAVHMTYSGVRLHAWIVLQELVPFIEKRLATGQWPRPPPVDSGPPPEPSYAPTEIAFDCKGG